MPLAWWGYKKDDRSHLLSSLTANLKDVGFTHITLLMIQFNLFVHSHSYTFVFIIFVLLL